MQAGGPGVPILHHGSPGAEVQATYRERSGAAPGGLAAHRRHAHRARAGRRACEKGCVRQFRPGEHQQQGDVLLLRLEGLVRGAGVGRRTACTRAHVSARTGSTARRTARAPANSSSARSAIGCAQSGQITGTSRRCRRRPVPSSRASGSTPSGSARTPAAGARTRTDQDDGYSAWDSPLRLGRDGAAARPQQAALRPVSAVITRTSRSLSEVCGVHHMPPAGARPGAFSAEQGMTCASQVSEEIKRTVGFGGMEELDRQIVAAARQGRADELHRPGQGHGPVHVGRAPAGAPAGTAWRHPAAMRGSRPPRPSGCR